MKKLAVAIALAGVLLNISACNNAGTQKKLDTKQATNKGKYYCPMDTSVTSELLGKCRKCGMKLVARDTTVHK